MAADPRPEDFNWPLRDDYKTPGDSDVADCRRAYFQDLLKHNQTALPEKRKYPARGFLRPGIDDMLIKYMDKLGIEIPAEGVTDHDETGRDDGGREG